MQSKVLAATTVAKPARPEGTADSGQWRQTDLTYRPAVRKFFPLWDYLNCLATLNNTDARFVTLSRLSLPQITARIGTDPKNPPLT